MKITVFGSTGPLGVDAVISLLGPKGKVKNTELSDGVKHIIESMNKGFIYFYMCLDGLHI